MTMKRTYFRILAVAAVGAMCSCSDFLDPYPSAIRSEDYILTNPTTMQGLVGKCYDYMAQNYNDNEGAYLDCATDNAVRTSTTDVLRRFAIGVTSPTNDPFETYWDRDYKGIYNVNMFLKDNRGLNMRYMLDEHLDELLRNRLWGEAYALRAWFQWDLLQKFGGRGTDGRLLGYPILLEPVRVWEISWCRTPTTAVCWGPRTGAVSTASAPWPSRRWFTSRGPVRASIPTATWSAGRRPPNAPRR